MPLEARTELLAKSSITHAFPSPSPSRHRKIPSRMAEDGLTDYERLRQENIRRNEAMLASVRRKAEELSAAIQAAKPKRVRTPGEKPAPLPPSSIVLRSRNPSAEPRSAQLSSSLASSILGSLPPEAKARADDFDAGKELVLKRAHVRRVVNSSIQSLRVLPLADRTVVAAGDKWGNIGFWDVDAASEDQDADGVVFRYVPHKTPVSAIVAHPAAPHKIYSSSYGGEICLMDFVEENFNMVNLWKCPVYSLCQAQDNVKHLYIGDESGDLTLFDERVGKVITTWDAHDDTIESIDFHPKNKHMIATSSTDGSACIWDVRNMKRKEPDSLKVFRLQESAKSAYFSPSGRMLAVTSIMPAASGTVRVFSVDDFEKSHTAEYNNQPSYFLSTFKVIWGWNDTDLYVGNKTKRIDIISVEVNDSGLSAQNSSYLRSQHMASVPCQFSAHPYKVGHLACSSSSGKVFLWTRA
ncbi:unnamed protein product [Alopecurus aequalis]